MCLFPSAGGCRLRPKTSLSPKCPFQKHPESGTSGPGGGFRARNLDLGQKRARGPAHPLASPTCALTLRPSPTPFVSPTCVQPHPSASPTCAPFASECPTSARTLRRGSHPGRLLQSALVKDWFRLTLVCACLAACSPPASAYPGSLQSLSFGHHFMQSLENVALPGSLLSLSFVFDFNQS